MRWFGRKRVPAVMPTAAEADAVWARLERAKREWHAALDEDGVFGRARRASRDGAEELAREARLQRAMVEEQAAQEAWSELMDRVRRATRGKR